MGYLNSKTLAYCGGLLYTVDTMKKLLFVPIIILGLFLSGNVFAEKSTLYPNDPIACTMEYAPVCGSKQVQCIKAPCDPIKKTYSNMCMMNADGASFVSQGECTDTTKIEPSFCRGNKFSKMNRGMRGDMVRALQEFLSGQGYKLGTIDGSFGLKTQKAVKDFQTAKGLESDGVFGSNSKFAACNIK